MIHQNATDVDTSKFAKKVDLATLKSIINKLDIRWSEATIVYLSKLSDVVKNEVFRKTEYNELFENFNTIQTTDTSHLVKETGSDTRIGEIEKKIIDHDHAKYITIQEFNKLMAGNFTVRLKQANLTTKA